MRFSLDNDQEVIKDISFPKSEIEFLKTKPIIVINRPISDVGKYNKGDFVFAAAVDDNYCFEITGIKSVDDRTAQFTFRRTKYERPYKLSVIAAKYPENVYKMLIKNKCHVWRARTGIDMIHLEPDDAEQARTCKNWRLLTAKYRDISDKKSIELFGYTNLEHEKMLIVDRIKKVFSGITYGLRDPKTNKPWKDTHQSTSFTDYDEQWRLGTPAETIAACIGNCYDTVAISREYLAKSDLRSMTFFMTTADSKFDGKHFTEAPTHTFLIYKDVKGVWKWLEGSWGPFKNNTFASSNPNELIGWIATATANGENKPIVVYQLLSYPKYGCDMTEFERFCRAGRMIGTFKPKK